MKAVQLHDEQFEVQIHRGRASQWNPSHCLAMRTFVDLILDDLITVKSMFLKHVCF